MADLYEILGVAKDATKETIKRAFRSKAKAAHPDTGGSAEEFHALELAHRVLSDDERRAEYDRTGSVNENPNQQEDVALHIIATFVERFLADAGFEFDKAPRYGGIFADEAMLQHMRSSYFTQGRR